MQIYLSADVKRLHDLMGLQDIGNNSTSIVSGLLTYTFFVYPECERMTIDVYAKSYNTTGILRVCPQHIRTFIGSDRRDYF
ncbi:hypothetical protein D3C86_1939020 [compost metagenome]